MLSLFREHYRGPLIVNAGIIAERAANIVAGDDVEAVSSRQARPCRHASSKGGPCNKPLQVGVCGGSDVGYLDDLILGASARVAAK